MSQDEGRESARFATRGKSIISQVSKKLSLSRKMNMLLIVAQKKGEC